MCVVLQMICRSPRRLWFGGYSGRFVFPGSDHWEQSGGSLVLVMILTAVLANLLSPYDPVIADYRTMLLPPSHDHWLGTDSYGRDVLSRIIYGSRTALLVGFSTSFFGATLGAIIGVGCAYFGGKVDLIVQRFVEIFLALPLIVLALAVVSVLGSGTGNVILAIAIPMVPRCAQVIRSSALSIREMPYIDAARAAGFSHARIIFRHMLPNVAAPYLILLTAFLGQAILVEASLSFLGMGVAAARPTRGGLHAQGRSGGVCRARPLDGHFPRSGH